MSVTDPEKFFNLKGYLHAGLFLKGAPVWEAVRQIELYLKAYNLGKIEITLPENIFLEKRELISIGPGTVIEPGAFIRGPCILGKECVVRHGAYLRGNVIAGDRCVIGHDTEVKNSIFLNGAHAAHFAYIGDSILGNAVNLGAGTICANLKFDRSAIEVRLAGERFKTGMHKLGVVLGDQAQTGCNSVLSPGTMFGKGACCYPCTHVTGDVPAHHLVKREERLVFKKC